MDFRLTGYTCLMFAFFLLGSVLIYWLFPKKIRWITLLVFSIGFYVWIDWRAIFFLAYSILLNYLIGLFITRNFNKQEKFLADNPNLDKAEKKKYKLKQKRIRKALLIIGIVGNVVVLAAMKYIFFIFSNINGVLSWFHSSVTVGFNQQITQSWFLPLGISFYTFQAISYIVDIYWGKYSAEKNFLKFSIFMSYFPKIMQGPIIRYGDMKDEFFSKKTFDYVTFTNGCKRMGYGFLKKMVVADTLAVFVTYAFAHDNLIEISGLETFFAVFFYFIQDYADFSGYMDISIGISDMFHVKLPENFRRPYFALSIDEYWRRWHMTLGAWFKDYIYYPLSISRFSMFLGKKSKKVFGSWGMRVPGIIGLILVWFLTGLWHGASWNFVLWGLYYGAIIIFSLCMEPVFNWFYDKTHIKRNNVGILIFKHARTIFLLAIGKILFITSSLSDAWLVFIKMFRFDLYNLSNLNNQLGYISIIAAMVAFIPVVVIDIIQEIKPETPFLEKFNKNHIALKWSLCVVMVLFTIWFGFYGSGLPTFAFGYTQF